MNQSRVEDSKKYFTEGEEEFNWMYEIRTQSIQVENLSRANSMLQSAFATQKIGECESET